MGYPKQGQFVCTGPQPGKRGFVDYYVGFCLQVRLNKGICGSHQVFLKHFDGSIRSHTNQAFFALTKEQEALARKVFTALPEDEDYEPGYTFMGKYGRSGFIIDDPTIPAEDGDITFAIKVTSKV